METGAKQVTGSLRTPQNNHKLLQSVNRNGEPVEEMTVAKCPNQENFVLKPLKKVLSPYFVLSYSNDVSQQMSPHQDSEENDRPHQILRVTMLSINTH